MPPDSHSIDEEGVLIDNFQVVSQGSFREQEITELFTATDYPVRNLAQNLADLKAQLAANEKGVQELRKIIENFSLNVTSLYEPRTEQCRRAGSQVLDVLKDGEFVQELDNGSEIHVKITVDKESRSADIEFTGTSLQQPGNFNAPFSITRVAVLYVFHTLVDIDIPIGIYDSVYFGQPSSHPILRIKRRKNRKDR